MWNPCVIPFFVTPDKLSHEDGDQDATRGVAGGGCQGAEEAAPVKNRVRAKPRPARSRVGEGAPVLAAPLGKPSGQAASSRRGAPVLATPPRMARPRRETAGSTWGWESPGKKPARGKEEAGRRGG